MPNLLTIKEASDWATNYLNKNVTTSNISYLIQYGRIRKIANNGSTHVDKNDLINYYEQSYNGRREIEWKSQLGDDLNWVLSFDHLARKQKIKGIFSSPPYIGLIDYHEQHAYSYEIFGFDRKDKLE